MNEFDRRRNRDCWESSDKGKSAFYAFCQAEERRLKDKLFYMKSGQIRSK